MAKKRVAVLISGRGSNMSALVEAAQSPAYPAEIVLVLSNRPAAAGLSHARAARIATSVVDHVPYGNERESFERAIEEVLERHQVEIVCLAGFMRVLTASCVKRWEGKMLNVHPALLPAFKGLDTHRRALAAGVKIHGATVHFVTADVDCGPIIAQGALAVRERDTPDTLAARVLAIEHRIYPMALAIVAVGNQRADTKGQLTELGELATDFLISF
ncbi:MAG TPA: phosphoribosylglycinamide formyltransferase [Xanthobacteraceae bacterium]|jgi:phosphoribosylglycinamide formyltransferase-1